MAPANPGPRLPEKTRSLEMRMEEKLNDYLRKNKGRFSLDRESRIGDISMALFRRYVHACVKNGILRETKDRYGIVWYSRPE